MIRSQRLIQSFCRLTAIDSPSFGERQMADHLTGRLREMGFAVTEDDAGRRSQGTAGNLFATLPGAGEPLLFSGHMDTVEPARGKKAVCHEDGTITSDGTTVLGADDAAGLAVLLEAVASLREDGSAHRPLELLISIAEEPYDRGSELFDFSRVRAREGYVLDLDGAVGRAAYAAPSICEFTVEITGRSAHAGFAPEKGIHAIAAAAKAIAALPIGRVDSETTCNIGRIEGGTAANIVPDRCLVRGELRSYSHETARRVFDSVSSVFARAAAEVGAVSRVQSRFGCRAYAVPTDDPVVCRYQAACRENGVEPQLIRTFGGSDANQLSQHGVCCIVIANAMFRPHTCQEYTTGKDLIKAAEIVQSLMRSRQ